MLAFFLHITKTKNPTFKGWVSLAGLPEFALIPVNSLDMSGSRESGQATDTFSVISRGFTPMCS